MGRNRQRRFLAVGLRFAGGQLMRTAQAGIDRTVGSAPTAGEAHARTSHGQGVWLRVHARQMHGPADMQEDVDTGLTRSLGSG